MHGGDIRDEQGQNRRGNEVTDIEVAREEHKQQQNCETAGDDEGEPRNTDVGPLGHAHAANHLSTASWPMPSFQRRAFAE